MNRRHFLAMLGIAPIAFNPHRVIFDMGRKLWVPKTRIDLLDMRWWSCVEIIPFGMRYHQNDIATGSWLALERHT